MNSIVPQQIITGLDAILKNLNDNKKIKRYKYLIGNPSDACLNNFDDSLWKRSDEPVRFKRDQGTTWFRLTVEVPEMIMDIPVKGSGLRLSSFFTVPIDIYVNGVLKFSERTWMDFKVPEIYLTNSAAPHEEFKIAVKLELEEFCYFSGQFSMNYIFDKVEDTEFEISSFKEELAYACRFNEVKDILPGVFKLISGCLESKEGVLKLIEKIRLSREMLKPMTTEAKKCTVHLIGHAHIDMNWFWSMGETLDLIKRDFDTMTQIMEDIPDFKFSQSQCAAYEMAETNFPDIFERMKKFIKSGNWDVTASTWVEGDMNMASGEAIVRHILYSKKYLKEKFDVEPRIMWCPDTFGHSANIPQILKKSGIDYYFFMRCGKESPIFWWEGLEGSRVLTFSMIYNMEMNAANILNMSTKLNDAYGLDNCIYIYGTGDHGGGPTKRDIKKAKLMNSYPTTPKLEFSTTHKFFDSVADERPVNIPIEKGELNFVFDGCYTTHADIKKFNRQCENLLVSTEILGTIGSLYGFEYKNNEIKNCWKTTLFNQFHDILDGSSIKATYNYSAELARNALISLSGISEESISQIGLKVNVSGKGTPFILFNTTGWERSEYIEIKKPDPSVESYIAVDSHDNKMPTQTTDLSVFVFAEKVPSLGYKVIYLDKMEIKPESDKIIENEDYFEIETKYYRLEIKKNSGEITTLFDKNNKKYVARKEQACWALKSGILNTLQINYEVPNSMSSWVVAPAGRIRNLISEAKAYIKEDGPIVKIINFEHKIDNSVISQDIIIYNDSLRIDFKTHVIWNEYGGPEREAPTLKACFTPDVNNGYATYEIPFGTVERPCKDMEVPGLKWVDISDENYGFSLLNDCKYGYKVTGNILEITLIRSGWEPDPKSDTGTHDFIYSILPHGGNWRESGVIKEGYSLNNRLIVAPIGICPDAVLPDIYSFIAIDNENIVVSSFKPAEFDRALILRLYEGAGISSRVKVTLGFNVERVVETDLNENKVYCVVDHTDRGFEFDISKFEIKTFKIYLNDSCN